MNITLPCELYSRMSAIPLMLDPADKRKYLKSIYVERLNNKLFVVTTNVKIAAIEFIGENDGPDEFFAVVIDPELIKHCDAETPFDSNLSIYRDPSTKVITIQTTFGYVHPGNANVPIPESNNFDGWRDWFPDEIPTKSFGGMHWNKASVGALCTASISGDVIFPEFIDIRQPVVIRDLQSENWVGLFMGSVKDETNLPATIPRWIE